MAALYAFVTLISSDSYLPGALALVTALRTVHPVPAVLPEVDFRTVCLVTPETVDVSCIKLLRRAFDVVIGVEIIEDERKMGLNLLGRPDLNTVLTKLHAFRLTQFSKVIFIDADVLPIRPMSHLFTLDHEFSAVPDVGWPDAFNSGMMVFSPGEDKFQQLIHLLKANGTWDGGDQGLLNEWRGENWNRLSFIYNTTPTAAYTYAPAYERFGSQISALHFIGQNKPWHSIPYRAPGVKHAQPSTSTSQQQAYDYESLVDRWYEVYDKHYRSDVIPSFEFEVQKYESVWNDQGTQGVKLSSGQVQDVSSSTFDLEQLRRMAVEGLTQLSSPSIGYSGEGEYHSLPLEGRVDLMRPKKEPQTASPKEPVAEVEANSSASPPMRTLPTPTPEDIPPTPYRPAISLPPTPVPIHPEQNNEIHTPESQLHHQGQRAQRSPTRVVDQYAPQADRGSPPGGREEANHLWVKHVIPQSNSNVQLPSSNGYDGPSVTVTISQPLSSHGRRSPPLLPWNPAIEPPPKTPPGLYAFPADTYFPNIWDQAPSKLHDATYQPHAQDTHSGQAPSPDWKTSAFFHPPPSSEIPERLVREGHYANVTGTSDGKEAPPTPDPSKVTPIFPWEEKPRHMPGRVFPTSDAPPPGTFLEREKTPVEHPSIQQTMHAYSPLSPIGLPFSLNYPNAWDTVPSIQNYASKLARPNHSFQHRSISPFQTNEWKKHEKEKFSPRLAIEEESSMDGDDEDEEVESKNSGKSTRTRSRSVSGSSTPRGKKYRARGVQTITKETRSQGVQVNTATTPTAASHSRVMRATSPDSEQWSVFPSGHPRAALGFNSALESPSGHESPRSSVSPRNYSPPTSLSPTVVRSLRSSPPGTRPSSKAASPQASSPQRGAGVTTTLLSVGTHPIPITPSMKSVPGLARSVSNDTALSSAGPSSPADTSPIVTHRKTSRVWDPARGVEIFKKDSEEVLSRFLKMGFDDNNAQHV